MYKMIRAIATTIARRARGAAWVACGAAAWLVAGAPAGAQGYPERPVRMVSVSSAGTGVDDYSRLLAAHMSQKLGQSVVVENRPGANTIIAAEHVAKSAPDGYTLLYGVSSTMSANPILFKSLPYSPERDFVPVARLTAIPNVLVVAASSPYQTLADLIAAAKARPGQLNAGSGTTGYRLLLAGFHESAGIKAQDVPYKATANVIQDLVGGAIDYSLIEVSAVTPLVQAGRVRALAVIAPKRVAALPGVPTLAEAGVPGVTLMSWTALFARAGTPQAIVDRLGRLALEFVDSPQAQSHYAARGSIAYPASGPELAQTIVDDRQQ
jgi:tripartite-type tricarboxylate transporter receptor subunit TctC